MCKFQVHLIDRSGVVATYMQKCMFLAIFSTFRAIVETEGVFQSLNTSYINMTPIVLAKTYISFRKILRAVWRQFTNMSKNSPFHPLEPSLHPHNFFLRGRNFFGRGILFLEWSLVPTYQILG